VSPTRNLDGAYMNSKFNPQYAVRGLGPEYYTPGPAAELPDVVNKDKKDKRPKQFPVNILS